MDFIIWLLASLLGRTWRITVNDPYGSDIYHDRGKGHIYSFWHRYLLPLAYIFRNTGKVAIVSKSRDGRIAAAVAQRWNYEIISGSSSRGGSTAIRNSDQRLKEGYCIAITPDGPRGPRCKVKKGVAQISLRTGAPIVVLKVRADRFWRLGSWDRMVIPKPFARIEVTVCRKIHPPSGTASFEENTGHLCTIVEEDMLRDEPMA